MDALHAQLNDLKNQNAHRYKPARFGFIESLIRRASQQRNSVRERLAEKAQQAIDEYQAQLSSAQTQAQAVIDELLQAEGNTATEKTLSTIQEYYQQGDYQKIIQIARGYRIHAHTPVQQQLADLIQQLTHNDTSDQATNDSLALNELLQQQEQHLLQDKPINVDDNQQIKNTELTLRSGRIYQQRQIKQRADNFIDTALAQTPENPGPLNPEMLAIRLLKSMRKLSPKYLNRCSSYFETLLWLEQSTSKSRNK